MSSVLASSAFLSFTEHGSGLPLLLVHGLMVSGETMLHDGIAGSRLVTIDGADHALIWTHSDELVRVTDEFLGIPLQRRTLH